MKVVFISEDANEIFKLPKDYPETYEFYQAFLDFVESQYLYKPTRKIVLAESSRPVFGKDFGNLSVYIKANDEVDLRYIGDVETRYLEAVEYLVNKNIDDKEKERIERWLYGRLHKSFDKFDRTRAEWESYLLDIGIEDLTDDEEINRKLDEAERQDPKYQEQLTNILNEFFSDKDTQTIDRKDIRLWLESLAL